MASLNPKQFIKQVFIDEMGELVEKHPFIAFMVMGIGIEFLGKCLDSASTNWNRPSQSSNDTFGLAIKNLAALKKYEDFLDPNTYKLYDSLRCGLIHAASPKYLITLSSKNEMAHLVEHIDANGITRLNLKCEDFYYDFKLGCEEVIARAFPNLYDKMNHDFIEIPGSLFNEDTNISTGITASKH